MLLATKKTPAVEAVIAAIEKTANERYTHSSKYYEEDGSLEEMKSKSYFQFKSPHGDDGEDVGAYNLYQSSVVYYNGMSPESAMTHPPRIITKHKDLKVFMDCYNRNTIFKYNDRDTEWDADLFLNICAATKGKRKKDLWLLPYKVVTKGYFFDKTVCDRRKPVLFTRNWTGSFI